VLKNKWKIIVLSLLVISLVLLIEGFYFRFWLTQEPQEFQIGRQYITVQSVANYDSPDDLAYRGTIMIGKTFTILEKQGNWLRVEVWEPESQISWENWIKVDENAFKPAGEK